VHFNPLAISSEHVEQWCQAAIDTFSEHASNAEPRVVSIPVRYGGEFGPDIEEAAKISGLGTASEVVRVHAGGDYRVYFLGFMGGFPYLGGLDPALASVPRLPTPRQKVPKGAVGIAAGQTGVYTLSTPGGWHVLGNTPMTLFDPSKDPPAQLQAGDLVKFVPAEDGVDTNARSAPEEPLATPEKPFMQVLTAGPMTTVQDVGRLGYARHGVSRSGAADGLAIRMGNALLRNSEDAAGLEIAMGGLKLRCAESCAVALTGADCGATMRRPGVESLIKVPINQVVQLREEDELTLGFATDGARAYLAVQGGIEVPSVLGSRSTDIRGGLGGLAGRVLQEGDVVGRMAAEEELEMVAAAHDPLRDVGADKASKVWQLRVLPGPGSPAGDASAPDASGDLQPLLHGSFKVSPRSDRMAVCLENSDTRSEIEGGEQLSEACVSGTIQIPPDGKPLILLAEHQTTGGYKVPGVVIQADLWQVGQMQPGDTLQFLKTTPAEATAALQQLRSMMQETVPGKKLEIKLPEPQLERSLHSSEVVPPQRPRGV